MQRLVTERFLARVMNDLAGMKSESSNQNGTSSNKLSPSSRKQDDEETFPQSGGHKVHNSGEVGVYMYLLPFLAADFRRQEMALIVLGWQWVAITPCLSLVASPELGSSQPGDGC